jgi:hypothetical protein
MQEKVYKLNKRGLQTIRKKLKILKTKGKSRSC